jgi:uncharacterized membrane protein YfcA
VDLYVLFTVGIAFFCGGVVKGVVGMGLPLTAIALMTIVIDFEIAIPLLLVPIIVTNSIQAVQGGNFKNLIRKFWGMLLAAGVGIFVGAYALYRLDPTYLLIGLGIVVCLYSINNLLTFRFSISENSIPLVSPFVGLLSGFLAGTTGAVGIPIAIYFQLLKMKKSIFVQAVGIQFLFTGLVLTFALFREGGLQNNAIIGSTIALIPTALGMWFGWLIRNRVSEEKFRVCLYFVLLFIGLNLIRKGIF